MKKIFFIIFLILNVSYLAQPTSNFNTPNIDGTSKKYFSIYDKTAWLWFNPVNRKMGLIDVSVFPKDTTYFGLDTAKSYILTGTWDFRKKVKIDSLEFTWNSGTSRDSTGYFKLPKLGKSLYPILQVGRFGFIDGGADLYYRTTPVVSSGYGNVDTLMSKYYFDRHKGLDTSKAYILTNNWYFNGIAKKVYFGSGHYLQLPGFSDGITEREIYYDALVHKIGVITNTGSKWLAYEESLIDSTKIGYLAKKNAWTNTNSFIDTVNIGTSNLYSGLINLRTISSSYHTTLSAIRSGTSTANNKSIVFPDSSGTVALLSNLSGVSRLSANETFTGDKTMSGNLTIDEGASTFRFLDSGKYLTLSWTSLPLANRTINFPDSSGNIPLLETVNDWIKANKFTNTFNALIVDTLRFRWSGTDSTGFLGLPLLKSSLYGSLQVGRMGWVPSGANLYNRSTVIISSGYGNVDSLLTHYYALRNYGRLGSVNVWTEFNTFQKLLKLGMPSSTSGSLGLYNSSNGFITYISSPNTATSDKYILTPNSDGTFALGTGVANQIAYWSDMNTLGALTTVTYPSLTELSYVKNVTSAIQTQINGKEPTIGVLIVTKGGTNNGGFYNDGEFLKFRSATQDFASSGYSASSFALVSHNQAWSTITSTPTTLSGYGITDGVSLSADNAFTGDVSTSKDFSNPQGSIAIASGTIDATDKTWIKLETTGGNRTVSTINGGADGKIISMYSNDATYTITFDEAGNLQVGGTNFVMSDNDTLTLRYSSTKSKWIEISRSDN